MAKKIKKSEPNFRVQITLRGQAAKHIDDLLQTGFYGTNRSKAISRLVSEALLAKLDDKNSKYGLIVKLEGYPAYAVLNYTRLTRGERKQVVDYIVNDWIGRNWKMLSDAGINFNDPEWKKYLKGRK